MAGGRTLHYRRLGSIASSAAGCVMRSRSRECRRGFHQNLGPGRKVSLSEIRSGLFGDSAAQELGSMRKFSADSPSARFFRVSGPEIPEKLLGFFRVSEARLELAWKKMLDLNRRWESAVDSARARLKAREAMALRMEAFLRQNRVVIIGVVGSGAAILLWKVGNVVAEISGTSFTQLFLLFFAASSVACTGLVLRTRYSVNPDAVHSLVMQKLQSSAGFLEIVGQPVVGGKARAYFTSGGDLKLTDLKPKLSCHRCFIVFPVQGYDRRALVSSEVVKDKGQYHVKLLAVDVQITADSDERLYLIGDDRAFAASGGPFGELRDPIFKAVAAESEFDLLDEAEAQQRRQMMKKWVLNMVTALRRLQKKARLSNLDR